MKIANIQILPCKKHNVQPEIRSVPIKDPECLPPYNITDFRQEYYCRKCEDKKRGLNVIDMINDWNKKQEQK